MLLLLHVISMLVSVLMILLKSKRLRDLLHILLNILAPNINAQAIIVDQLTRKSPLCKLLYNSANAGMHESLDLITSKNIDVVWNWVILTLHVVVYLPILIAIDGGLLKCSCSCTTESEFDDTKLDGDVLNERTRTLQLHRVPSKENALETDENDTEHETDHLIVHDLVKRFPGRPTPAVNHLTFGAKRGEAFGLLGYNVSHPSSFSTVRHTRLHSGSRQNNHVQDSRRRRNTHARHRLHRRTEHPSSSHIHSTSRLLSTARLQHGILDRSRWPLSLGTRAWCAFLTHPANGHNHQLLVSSRSIPAQLHPSAQWRHQTTIACRVGSHRSVISLFLLPSTCFVSVRFQDLHASPFSTSQRQASIPTLASRCKRSFSMQSKRN